ncbi:MAG: hypothetical protein LBC43_00615, partial [Bifidobacteriaceae bacterium]|nr:hypothetical protein [Bifidobacteriaceae bacterium]
MKTKIVKLFSLACSFALVFGISFVGISKATEPNCADAASLTYGYGGGYRHTSTVKYQGTYVQFIWTNNSTDGVYGLTPSSTTRTMTSTRTYIPGVTASTNTFVDF